MSTIRRLTQLMALTLIVVSIGMIAHPQTSFAAAAKCYSTTKSDAIQSLPICSTASLKAIGFVMTGLPNPLPANKCFAWGKKATDIGKEVNCNDPIYKNAAQIDSTTAPPLKSSPSPTANNANLSNSLATTDRSKVNNCTGLDSNGKSNSSKLQHCLTTNPIVETITLAINVLSGLVGVIVVIMVIIGGIQYTSAGANPQAVSAAKKKILNAVIALVALIFMYSFLQWLVPGGIF